MATKSTWHIEAIEASASSIYFWKITNILTGNITYFPVSSTSFELDYVSTSDYNFVWSKNEIDQLQLNILDVKYIGTSGPPNYSSASTDLASILALI